MTFDPGIHHRRFIRLKDYDYSQEGAYFVTICTHNPQCLFGEIINGDVQLNMIGKMIEKWWMKLPTKFNTVETDEYMIMPNHFHGIVLIVGADPCVCPKKKTDPHVGPDFYKKERGGHMGPPLPKIVQWFKTMSSNEYISGVKKNNWPFIGGKLWQRNYYEHIIRNEESLTKIREYIITNPQRWELDKNNPHRVGLDAFDQWLETFKKPPQKAEPRGY